MNYYNEFNAKAAAWLRELIKDGLIPDGEVDERSITDVRADDLRGFTQCHFFAGVGGWSLALSLAGFPDDREIWTGSCPCQSFSNAGTKKGAADERDLWPVFFDLVKTCRPELVFGEQVEAAIRHGWLDRVCANMETEGYTVGAAVLGAHSVGANHIRQRLYWGASRLAENSASLGRRGRDNADPAGYNRQIQAQGLGDGIGLADSEHKQQQGGISGRGIDSGEKGCGQTAELTGHCTTERLSDGVCGLADSSNNRLGGWNKPEEGTGELLSQRSGSDGIGLADSDSPGRGELRRGESVSQELASTECAGLPSFSPWSDSAFILCRDTDKQSRHRARRIPAESILLGVADGVSESVDSLRYQSICESPEKGFPLCKKGSVEGHNMLLAGYGNAIVPQCGAAFIEEFLESINGKELI